MEKESKIEKYKSEDMIIKLGYQLKQIHDKFRLAKDNVFKPLANILTF